MKFMFKISRGIKFWDPVEDSDTGGPSLITVRLEYLFAFQFWYCKLCVEKTDEEKAESIVLLILIL